MKNPCIVSYFQKNVYAKTPEYQRRVVEKFNKSKVPFYQVQAEMSHSVFMDYFWCKNGDTVEVMDQLGIDKQFDHDVVLFLDIDCVPLSEVAIDYYLEVASKGKLIGNIQRSNHLSNNQHVFAAPSALGISRETFIKIGKPSASETPRSDVAEEYTWKAEKHNVELELILPLSYTDPPIRFGWEKEYKDHWALKDGMPVYGRGTTFGTDKLGSLFYHNFQIFQPGEQEKFWNKCEGLLNA